MSVLPVGMAGASGSYSIANSIRLNGSSDYLSRTPGVAGNRQKFTISCWVKRATLGTAQKIFSACAYPSALDDTNTFQLQFLANDKIDIAGAATDWRVTTAVYRDPSAWLHIVVSVDTTTQTLTLYVNGSQVTAFDTNNAITSNLQTAVNSTAAQHRWGALNYSTVYYFGGYQSDCYLVDGQALTPSSFGKTDSNGVWVPIKYAGTYGTNGCKLEFKNSGALGTDTSGNGNSFTVNGSPVQTSDTPTNNHATLNAVDKPSAIALSNGNMTLASTDSNASWIMRSTIALSPGKWYWEFKPKQSTYVCASGVCSTDIPLDGTTYGSASTWLFGEYASSPVKRNNGSNTSYGTLPTTSTQVVMVAVDASSGKIWWGLDGTWFGSGDPAAGTNAAFTNLTGTLSPCFNANSAMQGTVNFGQTAFSYTPPTGFHALCTANLPAVSIKKPSKQFDAVLRAGGAPSGGTYNTSVDLTAGGLLWTKIRNGTSNHFLWDTVRGISNYLSSNSTAAEGSYANWYTSFNDGSYTTGSADWGSSNAVVDWIWKAGGAAVTNTAGSITSQVSVNATAGFSIVTYTGTGSNATVGHGLGAVPAMTIIRPRNAVNNWATWHKSLTSGKIVYLDATAAEANWGLLLQSAPSSTVINLGSNANTNGNGVNMLAYCFAEIPGYSKFGSYVGNGSTDGPFVYCGFRPRYLLWKRYDSSTNANWVIVDTARGTSNPVGPFVMAENSAAEGTNAYVDVTANGFKVRSNSTEINASGASYIFAAFAEYPFGGSNVAPSPAR